jgi:hypothetical protein
MSERNAQGDTEAEVASLARGVRLDLVIAVCALLVSSLATAASWWQTRVIQQQLSAQVWPYVSVSEGISNDTVSIDVDNDGLGPAILRSAELRVDGRPVDFIGALHAILGPNVIARVPHGERISLNLSSGTPGTVLRPSQTYNVFALTSKRFARSFLLGSKRGAFRICYCSILPDTCWMFDSSSTGDPEKRAACPEIKTDLLHAPVATELFSRF